MNLIGGRWCAALDGRTYMRPNPARPDDVIGHFPDSGPADGESAAQAAARTYPAWRDLVPTARSEVLHRAGDLIAARAGDLAAALTREEGKPLGLARGEVERIRAISFTGSTAVGLAVGVLSASVLTTRIDLARAFARRAEATLDFFTRRKTIAFAAL